MGGIMVEEWEGIVEYELGIRTMDDKWAWEGVVGNKVIKDN